MKKMLLIAVMAVGLAVFAAGCDQAATESATGKGTGTGAGPDPKAAEEREKAIEEAGEATEKTDE